MIDEIDRKIIDILQDDCNQAISIVAEKINLSVSACHRRISILEEKGVIKKYTAQIDPKSLGYNVTFLVEVSLESQSDEILSKFEKAAILQPEVLTCYLTTGSADYILMVAAKDTSHYEHIYRQKIATLPHVSRIQSSLIMKHVKEWRGYPAL